MRNINGQRQRSPEMCMYVILRALTNTWRGNVVENTIVNVHMCMPTNSCVAPKNGPNNFIKKRKKIIPIDETALGKGNNKPNTKMVA